MKQLHWILMVLVVSLASVGAHPGHGAGSGFGAGIAHPVNGLDHLCAMVAVGLWAVVLGGRALWLLPTTFVGVMILGAAAAFGGVTLGWVEEGILASVFILGGVLVAAVRSPLALAAGAVGLFAVFHGYAHGAELPAEGGALLYLAGFSLATALLHGAGLLLGLAVTRFGAAQAPWVFRLSGACVIACGVWVLVG